MNKTVVVYEIVKDNKVIKVFRDELRAIKYKWASLEWYALHIRRSQYSGS